MPSTRSSEGGTSKKRKLSERSRSDSQYQLHSQPNDVVRSPIWLSLDGSVVLQAENTQFLVHQGLLAKHSSVFRDMFSLPQPDNAEMVEERPLVRLPDSAAELAYLLTVLYEPFTLRNVALDDDSFPQLAGLLRLSTKYVIPDLRRTVVEAFEKWFPTTLEEWDDAAYPDLSSQNRFLSADLFEETEVWALLPSVLFMIALEPAGKISPSPLLPANKERVFTGARKLILTYHDMVASVFGKFTPGVSCRQTVGCQSAMWSCTSTSMRAGSVEDLTAADSRDVFSSWAQMKKTNDASRVFLDKKVCTECCHRGSSLWDEKKQKIWENLPAQFGLDGWAKLAERDASWYNDLTGQNNN